MYAHTHTHKILQWQVIREDFVTKFKEGRKRTSFIISQKLLRKGQEINSS